MVMHYSKFRSLSSTPAHGSIGLRTPPIYLNAPPLGAFATEVHIEITQWSLQHLVVGHNGKFGSLVEERLKDQISTLPI